MSKPVAVVLPVDISDFCYCGILAALLHVKHVIPLDNSSGQIPILFAQIASHISEKNAHHQ
jgi:hypothetical protein